MRKEAIAAVIALLVVVSLGVGYLATGGMTRTGISASQTSSQTVTYSKGSSTSVEGSVSSTETTTDTTTFNELFPCNCSVDIRWAWPVNYTSLSSLDSGSEYVVVANVTSTQTAGVSAPLYGYPSLSGTVPVTGYEISITQVLLGPPSLTPGYTFWVAEIGGTVNGTTMSVDGYPELSVGGTYVFFLNASGSTLTTFYSAVGNAQEWITVGGPQGLFYVQGGDVYSLDHMYPQADAWLPLKVNGVPLSEFAAEVIQAAQTSTTSSAAPG
jgi:hypothetical protein